MHLVNDMEAESHDALRHTNARMNTGEPLVAMLYRAVSGSGRRNGFMLSLST